MEADGSIESPLRLPTFSVYSTYDTHMLLLRLPPDDGESFFPPQVFIGIRTARPQRDFGKRIKSLVERKKMTHAVALRCVGLGLPVVRSYRRRPPSPLEESVQSVYILWKKLTTSML